MYTRLRNMLSQAAIRAYDLGIAPKQMIISYGVPRSGSTLIYQVLQRVFPAMRIQKTHAFISTRSRTVLTYRDFRDIMISHWRMTVVSAGESVSRKKKINPGDAARSSDLGQRKMTLEEVEQAARWIKEQVDLHLERYRGLSGDRVLWMQYELFHADFDYIFARLSDFFGLELDTELKRTIVEECSIQANRARASKLSGFSEYDPNSKIHGHHIQDGSVGYWRSALDERQQAVVAEILGSTLTRYGYE